MPATSMKMAVAKGVLGVATKSITLDLSVIEVGVNSTDADYIQFLVRVDLPNNLEFIQVLFSLNDTTFNSVYSRTIPVEDVLQPHEAAGIAAIDTVGDSETAFIFAATDDNEVTQSESDKLVLQLATTVLPLQVNIWTIVRIPLLGFIKTGLPDTTYTWANVKAVGLLVKANSNGAVNVWFDSMGLRGGSGLQGRYKYRITYYNDATGAESNPNPTPVAVNNIARNSVVLAAFPVPTDPQVTHINIWRTVGDGSVYFFNRRVSALTGPPITSVTDRTGDYFGMTAFDNTSLGTDVLQFDNMKPASTYESCCGPHYGRMFWTKDTIISKRGRVYYSPIGRPEGVQGFIDATDADDQTMCLAIWHGSIYCFAASGIVELMGTDVPFIPRRVLGAPGTTQPHTVKVTPFGIAYQAHDGVRIFDGNSSDLLFFDAVSKIMRGEQTAFHTPFKAICAAYGRDELVLTDCANSTLGCTKDGRWRVIKFGSNALYYDELNGEMIAAFANKILSLEYPQALDDDGDPVIFNIVTPTITPVNAISLASSYQNREVDMSQQVRIEAMVLDLNTNGEALDISIVIDNTRYSIGTISTTERTIRELPINKSGRIVQGYVFANLHNPIEIFHMEITISVGGTKNKVPLFDTNVPYAGLWLGYGSDTVPRFSFRNAFGVSTLRTQTVRSRPGSVKLFDVPQ